MGVESRLLQGRGKSFSPVLHHQFVHTFSLLLHLDSENKNPQIGKMYPVVMNPFTFEFHMDSVTLTIGELIIKYDRKMVFF